ncbi:hypothetical protein M422DRAFT_276243, partial [Sphaerobolus stellatus SS14]
MEMKSGDKRKSAISELLRRIWRQATGRQSNKLRWDEWAEDFVIARQCLVGWPADVTWPSGPAPYSSIDRGRGGRLLGEALLAEAGREIRIEKWTDEDITLTNSKPRSRLDKDLNWQKIAVIVDQEGNPLLTIGQIDEQAVLREKYIKDDHEKAASNGTGRRKRKGGAERSEGEGDGDEKGLNQDEEEPKAKKPKTKLKNAKAAGASQPPGRRTRKTAQPKLKTVIDDSDIESTDDRTAGEEQVHGTASVEDEHVEMVGGGHIEYEEQGQQVDKRKHAHGNSVQGDLSYSGRPGRAPSASPYLVPMTLGAPAAGGSYSGRPGRGPSASPYNTGMPMADPAGGASYNGRARGPSASPYVPAMALPTANDQSAVGAGVMESRPASHAQMRPQSRAFAYPLHSGP